MSQMLAISKKPEKVIDSRTNSPIKRQTGDMDLEKITPEFAAKIVKHFVLPMFENAASSKVSRRLGHKTAHA